MCNGCQSSMAISGKCPREGTLSISVQKFEPGKPVHFDMGVMFLDANDADDPTEPTRS